MAFGYQRYFEDLMYTTEYTPLAEKWSKLYLDNNPEDKQIYEDIISNKLWLLDDKRLVDFKNKVNDKYVNQMKIVIDKASDKISGIPISLSKNYYDNGHLEDEIDLTKAMVDQNLFGHYHHYCDTLGGPLGIRTNSMSYLLDIIARKHNLALETDEQIDDFLLKRNKANILKNDLSIPRKQLPMLSKYLKSNKMHLSDVKGLSIKDIYPLPVRLFESTIVENHDETNNLYQLSFNCQLIMTSLIYKETNRIDWTYYVLDIMPEIYTIVDKDLYNDDIIRYLANGIINIRVFLQFKIEDDKLMLDKLLAIPAFQVTNESKDPVLIEANHRLDRAAVKWLEELDSDCLQRDAVTRAIVKLTRENKAANGESIEDDPEYRYYNSLKTLDDTLKDEFHRKFSEVLDETVNLIASTIHIDYANQSKAK